MAKKTDSKIDKRSIARTLYLDGNYTQEEIAVKVGVSRQTIIRWSKEDSWAELKASLSVTPTQLIAQWQQQIAEINRTITSREEGARYATPAELMRCSSSPPPSRRYKMTSASAKSSASVCASLLGFAPSTWSKPKPSTASWMSSSKTKQALSDDTAGKASP